MRRCNDTVDDLVASRQTCNTISDMLEENRAFTKNKSGQQPRNKILLHGPIGTGKSLTSRIISGSMGYPLAYVRCDSVIASLGNTASNLRQIFDFISKEKAVLFFDAVDIIVRRRVPQGSNETSEVAGIFMQMLECFKGPSILVAATNQPHLLDDSIWLRFDVHISFGLPDESQRSRLFEQHLVGEKIDTYIPDDLFASVIGGFSGLDIAQVCQNAKRRRILKGAPKIWCDNLKRVIEEQREHIATRQDSSKNGVAS